MEQTEICDNCNNPFPSSKINSHFAYCVRNIKKCKQCQMMVDMNGLEEHIQEFHAKIACQFCKKEFEQNTINAHKLACDLKTVICQYCEQSVPMKQFDEHQQACGARTSPCPVCQRPIVLKNLYQHASTCEGKPPAPVQVPVSRNSYQDYINRERQKLGMEPRVVNTTVTVRAQQPSSVRVLPIQKVSIKSQDLKSSQPRVIRYEPTETRTVYYRTQSTPYTTSQATSTRTVTVPSTHTVVRTNSTNSSSYSSSTVEPTKITYVTREPIVNKITYVTKEPVITKRISQVKYEEGVKVYGGIQSMKTETYNQPYSVRNTTTVNSRVPGFQDEDEELQRALLQSMMMQ